jgi:hypothetical protein
MRNYNYAVLITISYNMRILKPKSGFARSANGHAYDDGKASLVQQPDLASDAKTACEGVW